MINEAHAYRIYPPLGVCMRWALKVSLWAGLSTVAAIVVTRWLSGQHFPGAFTDIAVKVVATLLGTGVVLGLVMFVLCRVWSATVKEGSLRATTLSGRMTEVPISSIIAVRSTSLQGLPVFIVKSNVSKSDLYIYTLGANTEAVHARLSALVGPEHPLAAAFGARGV